MKDRIILIIYRYMEEEVYKYNNIEEMCLDWEVKNIKELYEYFGNRIEVWKGRKINEYN